eukprot:CCRYP_020573-RA/>CCRYP_020573-RA protein AED:0.34 eAED:0.34 QI:0/0/0/1/1/1/3/0/453
MESRSIKNRTCSSPATVNRFSLESVMNRAATAYHLSNTAANGNHGSLQKARAVLNQAHSVYDLPSTEQAIKWMHAVCGYPVKSTWLKAIQAGNFVGWPLLTAKNVHKYYPDSAETPQGHLNQTRKNVRSTKPKSAPFKEVHSTQLRAAKSKTFTPLPTRPHPGHLQNVAELVPPGCHRRNAAEVAIRNFKSHFLSILAGVADDFPLKLWDKLLPQTEITLNLLRQSNATPTVSATPHLNGPFDYNKMPLAPMGCNAQVHEKPTHAEHGPSTADGCDTVHFHHKHITNPTLTPADKLMAAIADCSRALLTHAPPKGASNPRQLQELLQHTSTRLNSAGPQPPPPHTPHPPPRVEQRIEQPPPRVLDPNMRITRSMTTLPRHTSRAHPPRQHGTSPRDDDTPPAYLAPSADTPARTRDPKQQRSPNSPYLPHSTRDREASRIPPPTPLPNDKPHA